MVSYKTIEILQTCGMLVWTTTSLPTVVKFASVPASHSFACLVSHNTLEQNQFHALNGIEQGVRIVRNNDLV